MKPFGDSTHPARAVDPAQFRAQATGIGQTRSASAATGGNRAQRVVDQTDPGCRTWPAAEGFPSSTEDQMAALGVTLAPQRSTRR
jgi:hypothetical protein